MRFRTTSLRVTPVLLVLLLAMHADGQKQYWGAMPPSTVAGDPLASGGIFRVDSTAMGYELITPFDSVGDLGYMITGSALLKANNGRLYGITGTGISDGKLFWIDPVTDSLHIAVNFNTPQYPQYSTPSPWTSLMQTSSGLIVGSTGGFAGVDNATIFKFDPVTEVITPIATTPTTLCNNGLLYPSMIQGTPYEASDGYLYTISPLHACKSDQVVRIDPSLTSVTYHALSNVPGGYPLNGDNIRERNDTLYITSYRGGQGDDFNLGINGRGAIWGFDINDLTNFEIRGFTDSIHNPWTGLVEAPDGKWYGEAMGPPWNGGGFGQSTDTLCIYRFDPADNGLTHLQDNGIPPYDASVIGGPNLGSLLAASNGKLYGAFRNGLWEYDPVVDSLRLRAPLHYNNNGTIIGHGPTGALVEICRKPNYKPRSTTSFNVCEGAHFFYDLHNVNATGVVWRRNGVVVPAQTDQRLEFAAITEADEGIWSCTLTNQCGITEPPAITITVNAGTFTTSVISGDTLLCGIGDIASLGGNNGGTWSTGATSAELNVTEPGPYHVQHLQACGLSMSNMLQVVHLDSARTPGLLVDGVGTTADTVFLCPYSTSSIVFSGNDGGPWGTLPTGIWQNGSSAATYEATPADTGQVYVTAANACNSDTSHIFHVQWPPPPPAPQVAITDFPFGQPVDTYLCTGESLYLNSTQQDYYPVYMNAQFIGSLGGGGFAQPLQINAAGTYSVLRYDCGPLPLDTLTITVFLDTLAPGTAPVILPDQLILEGCDQDTAFLTAGTYPAYWTWFDGAQFVNDTAETLLVDWSVGQYTLTSFNGCGTGPQDVIATVGITAPDVLYSEADDTVCLNSPPFALAPGTPAGGTYTGPGITGSTFDPAAAGAGTHTITYSYNDGTCTGYAQDAVVVDICSVLDETLAAQCGITLRLAPNPVHDLLRVSSENGAILGYDLFDATGRRVRSASVNAFQFTLHRDGLQPGAYFLHVRFADGSATRKVTMD